MNLPHPGGGSAWETWSSAYLRLSDRVLQVFSIAVLVAMTAVNALNITSRALFDSDYEGTQELLEIGAMGLYFLSVALITKGNADLRIDALVRILPGPWQRLFGVVARLSVMGLQGTVFCLALRTFFFVRMFHTPVLGFSQAVFFVPVIIGAGDMAITELIFLSRQLRRSIGPPGSGLARSRLPDPETA